jgi:uncharacterized damage-inducible protein DinB
MLEPALTATELIAWLETISSNWHELLNAHPEIFALPCDIMNTSSVAQLLQHIVAVELRYAQRLANLPVSEYADVPCDTPDAIYATHHQAMTILRGLLAADEDWDAPIEFTTRAFGLSRSTRRTLLFHTLMHGIRHYAQLATLVRKHGIKPGRPMDYLFMQLEPA